MTLSTRLIPIAAAAALAFGGALPARAAEGFDPAAVVQVGERHWHHHRGWGPPGYYRRHWGPPAYYLPPPRVYYPPPRVYYAPPPPPRYYYAPQPSIGLYFRF